jgi:hypothetical protein
MPRAGTGAARAVYPGMRLFLAVLFLLVAAPAAQAGGFATVGLSSTPGDREWTVDITVLQHGVTPLEGVTPHVDITAGATTRTFAARPTGTPGVYRADVVFPHGGRWTYQVRDGFTDISPHTFKAVTIPGAPAGAGAAGDDGGIDLVLLVPGLVLLVAAPLLLLLPRLRRAPEPAL